MASPRRRIPDQRAELSRAPRDSAPAKAPAEHGRPRFRLIAVPACLALATVSLAIGGHSGSQVGSSLRCVPFEDATRAWVRIVRHLVGDVPPRLLLGAGHAPHQVLDAAVEDYGMTRECFDEVASVVIRAVARTPDRTADETMALVLQEIPLPDGIETPDASQYGIVEISPDLEEARGLVHELVARLRAPDLHGSAR